MTDRDKLNFVDAIVIVCMLSCAQHGSVVDAALIFACAVMAELAE